MLIRNNIVKMIFSILFLFLTCSSSFSKVTYNKNPMKDLHFFTIQGFLYDASHRMMTPEHRLYWAPQFAKALVWLKQKRQSRKVYNLDIEKVDEAKVILDAVGVITEIVNGKYPNIDPEKALTYWAVLGKKVIVEYKTIKKKNPKTRRIEKQIKWKFELQKNKPKPEN